MEDTIKNGYTNTFISLNENGSPNNVYHMHIDLVSLGLFPPHTLPLWFFCYVKNTVLTCFFMFYARLLLIFRFLLYICITPVLQTFPLIVNGWILFQSNFILLRLNSPTCHYSFEFSDHHPNPLSHSPQKLSAHVQFMIKYGSFL